MFSSRRLLIKQRVINKNNLQRINPLNECENVYIPKNNLNNPLNECENVYIPKNNLQRINPLNECEKTVHKP